METSSISICISQFNPSNRSSIEECPPRIYGCLFLHWVYPCVILYLNYLYLRIVLAVACSFSTQVSGQERTESDYGFDCSICALNGYRSCAHSQACKRFYCQDSVRIGCGCEIYGRYFPCRFGSLLAGQGQGEEKARSGKEGAAT